MTYKELYNQIKKKKSFLCVGLDSDLAKIPACIKEKFGASNAQYEFNKAIVKATARYAVAYKINTAFYESNGAQGFEQMALTVKYIKKYYPEIFVIADAKRGDIGNTAEQYAKAFFERMNFDAVTISPFMGEDAVSPFLKYKGKWAIVLALTSNKSAEDFETAGVELNSVGDKKKIVPLYEKVIHEAAKWGNSGNIMFVVGATRPEKLAEIRILAPDSFFLVPGVGAQGGSVNEVATHGINGSCGLLVNSSRGIIFASLEKDFASAAQAKAKELAMQMSLFVK
ncbi:MAG: orotidine-5'-phosphate decarboxylase [Bacteroidales bacterium]|jgi:orotidine-5'-phosphate decarboxylase|nr:orotidine-5'-phosphate decarboxylase [Bacteroidales bacterium]MCI1733315.1 orotidine-5'-phosphate decarboxylase [Bacteroidales bacterium]